MPFSIGTGISPFYRRPTSAPTVTTTPLPDFAEQQAALDDQYADIDAQLAALQSSPAYNKSVGNLSLGLPRLSLSAPLPVNTASEYTSPTASAPTTSPAPTGAYTGGSTGSYGLSAYGFSGNSGGAGTKGTAKYGFQPQMWSALQAANSAMAKAGLGTFSITDGWRSYEAQVDLKKRKPTLAAKPGTSVHGLGLAADLGLTDKQFKWLKQNGAKYGLVNLPSESWHWQLAPSAYKR